MKLFGRKKTESTSAIESSRLATEPGKSYLDCSGNEMDEIVRTVKNLAAAIRKHPEELGKPGSTHKFIVTFDEDRVDPETLIGTIMMNVRGCGPGFWSTGEPLEFTVQL